MANADPSFFDSIGGDISSAKQSILGPSYDYVGNIRLPSEIGMSSAGTLKALGKDIDGLAAYLQLLVSGGGSASKAPGPMGNKFFLQTGAKCMGSYDINGNAVATPVEQSRYIYINNVPNGDIPFISGAMGVNFSDFEGLIPGSMGNLNVLNPFAILQSFMSGATPPCQEITMQTINNNNTKSSETHFVTTTDIKNMDPCSFSDKKNPINGNKCKETFKTGVSANASSVEMPDDAIAQLYFAGLAFVGIYILHRFMEKSR